MPPVKPRHAALEVARRCACKPCREQVALAAERAIREAEERLRGAVHGLPDQPMMLPARVYMDDVPVVSYEEYCKLRGAAGRLMDVKERLAKALVDVLLATGNKTSGLGYTYEFVEPSTGPTLQDAILSARAALEQAGVVLE